MPKIAQDDDCRPSITQKSRVRSGIRGGELRVELSENGKLAMLTTRVLWKDVGLVNYSTDILNFTLLRKRDDCLDNEQVILCTSYGTLDQA